MPAKRIMRLRGFGKDAATGESSRCPCQLETLDSACACGGGVQNHRPIRGWLEMRSKADSSINTEYLAINISAAMGPNMFSDAL